MKQHIRRLLAGRSQPQRRGTLMRMIATRTEARPATGRARRLFTREDYHSMGRMGVLGPDERLELIEGEIIVMSPAGIRHSSCVLRLTEAFNTERLAGRALVHVQNSMAASNISEPEPDVMLLAYRDDRYASRRPQPDDILLLIEVSDSSLKYDHETKLPLYAAVRNPRGVDRRSATRRNRIPPVSPAPRVTAPCGASSRETRWHPPLYRTLSCKRPGSCLRASRDPRSLAAAAGTA